MIYVQGRVEEAKAVYREAADVELNCVEAVYNLGLCHKKLGALEDALSTFKKLTNFLPNNIEVLFQVKYLYLSAMPLVSSECKGEKLRSSLLA